MVERLPQVAQEYNRSAMPSSSSTKEEKIAAPAAMTMWILEQILAVHHGVHDLLPQAPQKLLDEHGVA